GKPDLRRIAERVLQCWVVGRPDVKLPIPHLPDIRKEATRRRAGGALAAGIVDPAVTGAHEEPRLREPGDGTAQVGAVDGEHEELRPLVAVEPLVADEGPGLGDLAIPRLPDRVEKGYQARLALRKPGERAQVDPFLRLLAESPEQEAEEGSPQHRRGE